MDTYEPLSEAPFCPDAYDNPDIMEHLLKSSEAFFDPINCMFFEEPIWDHQVVFAQLLPHEVIGIIRDQGGRPRKAPAGSAKGWHTDEHGG